MSDVDAMVAFTRAQIEADKAAAEAVRPASDLYPNDPIEFIIAGIEPSTSETEAAERHIRRHDPHDVIADCDAKLRMLNDLYPEIHDADVAIEAEWGDTCDNAGLLLRLLAQGYQHRDGYRDEWRPSQD